jgi:hypothetical protein
MNIRSRIKMLERKLTPRKSPPRIMISPTDEEVADWRLRHPGEHVLILHTLPRKQQIADQ